MTILSHTFTDSTAIASASYDTEEAEMQVTFCSGRNYAYIDVPKEIYLNLIEAKSAGKQFAIIKNQLVLK